MSIYDIAIDYKTGNSFGSEEIEGELLCLPTTSLKIAKQNLKSIQEHYAKYGDSPSTGAYFSLCLRTDKGTRIISPFWIGYFETLQGARIVSEDAGISFKV